MKLKFLLLFVPFMAGLPVIAYALNVGFEAQVSGQASDNINQSSQGSEISGATTSGLVSVFGDHQSRKVKFGFNGELSTYKQFDDQDTNEDSIYVTRFYGSLEAALTRNISWYFGDVLGGSRNDRNVGASDQEILANRRNVFVTGPSVNFDLRAGRSTDASLHYINTSDDQNTEFAELYSFKSGFYTPLGPGMKGGVRLGVVALDSTNEALEPDYQRITSGIFINRTRASNSLLANIGLTQYLLDGYELNGPSVELRWDRTLTKSSRTFISLSRQLTDESLNSASDLAQTGDTNVAAVKGIFASTVLQAGYNHSAGNRTWGVVAGAADSAYEAVLMGGSYTEEGRAEQDEIVYYAGLKYNTSLSARAGLALYANMSVNQFDNKDDFSNSTVAGVSATYKFGRSFYFALTYEHDIRESMETSSTGSESDEESVENRIHASIRYIPLSRVDKNLITKLKTLAY